ncbi:AAA-like domain protein [Rubripirellula lacrimiformis]|uniref:AAA-like domain protein n=1 Tax=Rubripirellula lacrimiformis TaxID=1930273 RepID=A0A517NAQ7_9BACT|nr:ATP-binding protein [Rubripirellula lacrimiformis]QDT04219.1 AAA-like domain protein [Rubripirellula lacrimiformis]
MPDAALQFKSTDILGKVAAVDTTRVLIGVSDPQLITRVGIGNLIAVKGSTEHEFLIGITEKVTRSIREEFLDEEQESSDSLELGFRADDVVRVVLVGTFRTVQGDEPNKFKRGADTFPQIDRDCYFIEGANLQRFMGLLGAELKEEERLELGNFVIDPNAKAVASGDRFFQRHASILGSTGSGKSYAVALLLERASKLKHPNIIVFDMHGEYEPLADKKNGYATRYRIAGPGDLDAPGDDVLFLPYWLLNRDEMLSMILDRSDQNAPNQASRFTSHVRDLKLQTLQAEKQTETEMTFTVDSPIPYDIGELVSRVEHDDTEMVPGKTAKPVKGDWNGKLTRFLGRMKAKLDDRRYGFLFHPPQAAMEYDWLAKQLVSALRSDPDRPGIKIIDFSEVPTDVLPIVTGTFARLLYDLQFWLRPEKRTPFSIICDEAHLYLPVKDDADAVEKQALATFERIAKEGRKYGVSLVVVSQRPSDVSRTILSQCNNFLVLRLTNDRDQSVVGRLIPDSMSGLMEMLPLLDIGEALLLGDA